MSEYDAVVYDLDGTLVRLAVDWDAVARDVAAVLVERGVHPGDDLWGMLTVADETGHREVVETTIARHEEAGARDSDRLATAEELPREEPVGVCSLNCEAACRIALATHGLDGYVRTVVGRDTVLTEKPDPEPLLRAVETLDARPERTLFVGDGERDELTAERAGCQFRYVD